MAAELEKTLGEKASEAHIERLEMGLGEFTGAEPPTISQVEVLSAIHGTPEGYYKTKLPVEEYPEIYAVRGRSRDVLDAIRKKQKADG